MRRTWPGAGELMPLFDYTGQLPSGTAFQGTLEAEDQARADALLARLGVRVTTLRPARRTAFVTPLSLNDFTFFNEQLAALSKASLPLEEGLRQMAADVGSRRLKRLLSDLADDLAAGTPLPQALERHKARFPGEYPGVVGAALETGDLGSTLYGLTTHLRLKSTVRRSLIELAAYPFLVVVLSLLVTSFVMRAIMPALQETVVDLGGRIVAPVFTVAHAWPWIEATLAGLLTLLAAFGILCGLPGWRGVRERVLRAIPGVAQVYWSSVIARFAHTSALAAFSGSPLPQLLLTSGAASGSRALAAATRRIAERIGTGRTLAEAAHDERDVPGLWTCAVEVAGPRGDLPAALADLARTYEQRAQHWVNTLRAILGPFLLLLVALGIGGIILLVFSVIQTLVGLIQSVSGP